MNYESTYKLKHFKEDFVVTEVPLYPEFNQVKNQFSHTYIWLKKRGYTTFEAAEKIAKYFNLNPEAVSYQGLKDEQAVTYQIISIANILSSEELDIFNSKHKHVDREIFLAKILGYGNDPVTARCLHGNSFTIVIRNLETLLAEKLFSYCQENKFIPYINYYDNQRFGMDGGPYNTHLIGQRVIEGNWDAAFDEFSITKNMTPELYHASLTTAGSKGSQEFFKLLDQRKLSFFISAFNSFNWNIEVSKVLSELNKCLEVFFEHIGNLNLPVSNNFNCSTMIGIDGYKFNAESFSAEPREFKRSVMLSSAVYPLEITNDEVFNGKSKLKLSFFLPTGSYATMFIKQLISKVNV